MNNAVEHKVVKAVEHKVVNHAGSFTWLFDFWAPRYWLGGSLFRCITTLKRFRSLGFSQVRKQGVVMTDDADVKVASMASDRAAVFFRLKNTLELIQKA